MKFKKYICEVLSAAMLFGIGVIPVRATQIENKAEIYADSGSADLSEYINDTDMVFDIADSYPDYPDGWTGATSLDNDEYNYLGVNAARLDMGDGYGAGKSWMALRFDMAANSDGDNVIYDADGKKIIGYCYAKGTDGFWVGHGERSFGGTVRDSYGVRRLSNYLKTETGDGSSRTDTGHTTYSQHDTAVIIVKNENGTVDDYTGDYYTVKTYCNNLLISTEYYSGHRSGIGAIETSAAQYFGALTIYAPADETPATAAPATAAPEVSQPEEGTDTSHMLFGANFNNQNIAAYKGTATENGDITYTDDGEGGYAAVFDGIGSYISLKDDDGDALLSGKDNIIVSLRAKTEKGSTSGWYFYTAYNNAKQVNSKRNYIGLLDNYTSIVGERFRNNNGTPTVKASSKLGEWQEITYVVSENKSELYIDGEFCGEAEYTFSLDDILSGSTAEATLIGKANWDAGEYFKGAMDDIEIYDFAPEFDFEGFDNVKTDINLPQASKAEDGYDITWESSDESVISTDGRVTRPQTGAQDVTLTATIAFGTHTLTRTTTATVRGMDYYDFSVEISEDKDADIRSNMFGLFFEDINYAADGGLYAEMVENRSFEQVTTNSTWGTGKFHANPGYAWSSENGTMTYSSDTPINDKNPTYLEFTGKSFQNSAYEGMYIEKDKKYRVSFLAKSSDYGGAVNVSVAKDGVAALSGTVAAALDDEWTKYELELTAAETVRNGEFTVELADEGTADFDMISVMPEDAVCGVFRRDLAEKLKALNPGFLRFPGGCIIEGYNLADRYRWKDSVGAAEERVQNWNRWAADTGYVNYNQTLGIGYYEYFELCEYLGCDPVPVLSVGLSCEYQANETVPVYEDDGATYTEEFYEYIQDALDLIEFANGTDFENSEWAALRRDMGHEEPFNLTMLGIGNEQWKTDTNQWYDRYEAFESEIHNVYPDMKLISTSGPSASGTLFDDAWSWIRENQAENDSFTYAVDEHYYMSPEWFLANDTRYDGYDRDTKVFAGEYAAHTSRTSDAAEKNNLESALAEAAFLTGVERNADVVYMASYAPLFARIGYTQWAPDMIWFDNAQSYVTPNYYVQSMYMNNVGTYTLKNSVTNNSGDKVYQSVSYDDASGDVIVKIANPYAYSMSVNLLLDDGFITDTEADMTILGGGSKDDCNSIDSPDNIAPETMTIDASNDMTASIPALSFAVIRIHTGLINITKCEPEDGMLEFEAKLNAEASDCDTYIAVYDEDGRLLKVVKNELSGTVKVQSDGEYDVKAMVWDKKTIKPASKAVTFAVTEK